MYTPYHILKRYIKHKKNNCITLPISNIMIKKMAKKLLFTYIITLFFNNLYRCILCKKIMTNYTSYINIILKL